MSFMYRKGKYNATKVVIDGVRYDSKKEGRRACELRMLEKAGVISGLKFQVPFLLQDGFRYNGKAERAIKYVADATYTENGKHIVEDTKSPGTRLNRVYQMKRKMLLFRYPEIMFREY